VAERVNLTALQQKVLRYLVERGEECLQGHVAHVYRLEALRLLEARGRFPRSSPRQRAPDMEGKRRQSRGKALLKLDDKSARRVILLSQKTT